MPMTSAPMRSVRNLITRCPIASAFARTRVLVVASIWLALASGIAGAGEITLYEDDNFGGQRFTARGPISDLGGSGFNDRASSVDVRGGPWQLCTDSSYRGDCVTLAPGTYRSLGAMGLNDRVSSVREVAGAAAGNPGQPGGSIVLYEYPGLTGRAVTVDRPVADFSSIGFNDRAQSAYVNSGNWQLCSDADFSSTCEVFRPGRWENLGGVTGQVSSARTIDVGGSGSGSGSGRDRPGGAGGHGGKARVVLFEGSNLSGRSFALSNDVLVNFGGTGFNDRASSLRVERGYWMFCSEANFLGECRTFGPGEYANLPPALNNRISSGRRISNDYPYNAQPRW